MKRRRLAFIAFLVIGVLAVIVWNRSKQIPAYQGKDVYEWMFAQTSSALESSPGFMAIGSNAVPYLARALATDRTRYDRHAWVRSPVFQRLAERRHLIYT